MEPGRYVLEFLLALAFALLIPIEWTIYIIQLIYNKITNSGVYKLDGKIAVITGAGSGIGKATAILLAKRGCYVIILEYNLDSAEAVVDSIGHDKAECYQCDVSKREAVYEVAEKITAKHGKIDILVNNAGILGEGKPILESSDQINERVIQINLLSNFWTIKAFIKGMMERNSGCIVTLGSTTSYLANPGLIDYGVSKMGVRGLHESLMAELYMHGYDGVNALFVAPVKANSGLFNSPIEGAISVDVVANEIVNGMENRKFFVAVPKSSGFWFSQFRGVCSPKMLRQFMKMAGISGISGSDVINLRENVVKSE